MPPKLCLRLCTASARGGFTLVELLVVIGIIAILAGVALGPITNGIKQAQHDAAMQQGRQLGQMCFSYATDNTANGNQYPCDVNGLAIAQDLLNSGYATDPTVFGVPQQAGYVKPTGASTTLVATNVSWSFTCVSTAPPQSGGGITSAASDLTPLVYFNAGPGTAVVFSFPISTSATGQPATLSTACPFGTDGIAVFYKGNNAMYLKSGTGGSAIGTVPGFISGNDSDATQYKVAP